MRGQRPQELPPRTRRILFIAHALLLFLGTTSAHAENTSRRSGTGAAMRNYLRARGEYSANEDAWADDLELPPRTRRIHTVDNLLGHIIGTTSAHAENTSGNYRVEVNIRNYLRARGEYHDGTLMPMIFMELPPRTRRIPLFAFRDPRIRGTTSAHAENTAGKPLLAYAR